MTDHQPLKWLLTMKSPTGRLARWALQIQQYNFQVKYTPGKSNGLADMLSRPPCDADDHTNSPTCICAFHVDVPRRSLTEIREEQLKDEYIKAIILSLESQDDNLMLWTNRGYVLNDGILYCYNSDAEDAQLVVPTHERKLILKKYHDEDSAGHYGVARTISRISNRHYWPGMRTDIAKHIRSCIECQRYKAANMKPMGLLQTTSSNKRFEVVSVDLFGPLPQTEDGFQWILIAEDVASRWVELFPLREATSEVCAKTLIDEIFLRYGIPRRLKSDNGVQFVSAVMQKVAYCLGIHQQLTPVYHPEANPVERRNRDLKAQLGILVGNEHTSWSQHIPSIRFAMNSAKCQSTSFTPAYLTFGREMRTLDDVQHDVRAIVESENFIPQISPYLRNITENLKSAKEIEQRLQDKNKTFVDKHRRPQTSFDVGTEVLVTTHILSKSARGITAKFVPKRDGPYVIVRKIGSTSYEIASRKNLNIPLGTYHVSSLTLYKGTNKDEPPNPLQPLKKRGRPKKSGNQ